jgi:hypothetical protein
MPWDSSRNVPWRRLIREAALFGALMVLIFGLFTDASVASYLGLLGGLAVYVALMAALAKFGYTRRTLADMRAEREAVTAQAAARSATSAPAQRTKPAPTKRTGGGQQRASAKRRR